MDVFPYMGDMSGIDEEEFPKLIQAILMTHNARVDVHEVLYDKDSGLYNLTICELNCKDGGDRLIFMKDLDSLLDREGILYYKQVLGLKKHDRNDDDVEAWRYTIQAQKTPDKFLVMKWEYLAKLSKDQLKALESIVNQYQSVRKLHNKKPEPEYYVCNSDESYAPKIIETILEGEKERVINSKNVE